MVLRIFQYAVADKQLLSTKLSVKTFIILDHFHITDFCT